MRAASADVLTDQLGMGLPADRDFTTVAGFALDVLRHLPDVGEKFDFHGWTFEVVDLDGRKIDKLLVYGPSRKRRQDAGAKGAQG